MDPEQWFMRLLLSLFLMHVSFVVSVALLTIVVWELSPPEPDFDSWMYDVSDKHGREK